MTFPLSITDHPFHHARKPRQKGDIGPCDDKDCDFADFIIPWNRYCPELREVKLVQGQVWKRGFEGGAWGRYLCEQEEDEDGRAEKLRRRPRQPDVIDLTSETESEGDDA